MNFSFVEVTTEPPPIGGGVASGEIQINQMQIEGRVGGGGEDPRAGFDITRSGAYRRDKGGLPPTENFETQESCRAVVIRRLVARSESREDEVVEVWPGVRHGEERAQESVVTAKCLQQHLEMGFAKKGKEPPTQEKAVSRTTNHFMLQI